MTERLTSMHSLPAVLNQTLRYCSCLCFTSIVLIWFSSIIRPIKLCLPYLTSLSSLFIPSLLFSFLFFFFFFNDTAPTEIYPLPLHDALPISRDVPPRTLRVRLPVVFALE